MTSIIDNIDCREADIKYITSVKLYLVIKVFYES